MHVFRRNAQGKVENIQRGSPVSVNSFRDQTVTKKKTNGVQDGSRKSKNVNIGLK